MHQISYCYIKKYFLEHTTPYSQNCRRIEKPYMQHYNDDEYDSYEEYSNEIDQSTAKKGKSGSK